MTEMEPVGKFKLPASTTWVDAETFEPLLMESDFPGARRPGHVPPHHEGGRDRRRSTRPVEVFNAQSIRLDREIPGIHGRGPSSTRWRSRATTNPGRCSPPTPGRQVKNLDPKAKTLRVARLGEPRAGRRTPTPQPAPGKEFTEQQLLHQLGQRRA